MTEEEYLLFQEQQQQQAYEAAAGVQQEEEEEPESTSTPQPSAETPVTPPEQPTTTPEPTEDTNTQQGEFNPLEALQGAIQDPIGTFQKAQDAVSNITNPEIKDPNAALVSDVTRMIPTALTQGPSGVIGQAFQDLGMDAIGSLPGLGWVDDQYDKNTRFNNPHLQMIREKLSVLIPAGLGGAAATQVTGGMAAPAVVKGLTSLGLGVAADATIAGVSDQSETENNTLRDLDDMFPQLNIPDRFKTLDGDSPEVRTEKHIYDSIGMSLVGEFLGFSLQAGKPIMRWFKPLNRTAENYKANQLSTVMDSETATAIAQIDEMVSTGAIDPKQLDNLYNQRKELIRQAEETGSSDVTTSPLEASVARADDTRQMQIDEDGINALREAPESVEFNPTITSSITDEMNVPRSSIPAGNIARNMADVDAIKRGIVPNTATPAPVLTSPMIRKGIGVNGTTRNMVVAVAEGTRETGRFSAVTDGVRQAKQEMNASAWNVYQGIFLADSMDDVRQLFASRRDIKNILDGQIEYINEEQAMGVGFAMRDLVNTYLGREVTEASARVMDTLGREVTAQTKALTQFGSAANQEAVMDLVFDKLNFLMDEYAVNKYVSGWQLQNKRWWQGRFGNQAGEELEMTTKMFDDAIKAKKGMNKALTEQIKQLAKSDPEMASALVDAYAISDGNVDTLVKLNKYVEQQLNPLSALVTPKGMDKMTSFASGLWSVKFNNILSGLAAIRTGVGATVLNTLKAVNAITGSGIESLVTRDPAAIRESLYVYSAWVETNRRALKYGWSEWKRANSDPNFATDASRQDFVFESEKNLELLDKVASSWGDDQYGKKFLYSWNKTNHKVSKSPYMRWGTNAMVGVDGFTKSTQATLQSRAEMYLKAAKKGVSVESFRDAERANYSQMFDKDGRLTNKAALNAAGEINMNLDDGIASIISSGTTSVPVLRSLFTFPKTGINALKYATSYTPIAVIPGMTKYNKILMAGQDLDKIKIALGEHGVDFDTTPNAMQIYNNLRREYIGRQASAAVFVSAGMAYGLAGNVRGPGHHNPSQRAKERDNLGYIPYTVKIPFTNKWFDYRGLGEPAASLLTVIGSASYYLGQTDQPIMQDIQDKLAWTVTAAYTNQSFVSQLEPLAALFTLDETAITRFASNEARSFIPQSGALGVLSNAISSAQKDIHNDFMGYIMNRLPGPNTMLPERIDYWTGEALNDIDNPLLRAINAGNPLKVSDGVEPWRTELLAIGYDGLALVSKDTSGVLEYPAEVREEIYSRMGQTKPYKEAQRILGMEKYQKEINSLKKARAAGMTTEQIRGQDTEVFDRLDEVVRNSLKAAEASVMNDNENIRDYIEMGKQSRRYVELGRTEEATTIQKQMETLLKSIK